MKNQAGSPSLGSRGKSMCICVLCVMLSHCLFFVFQNLYAGNFCTRLKPTKQFPLEFSWRVLLGLFLFGIPTPQRISVLYDHSSLGCPIPLSKIIECKIITKSSIMSSQVKKKMICLSPHLKQRGHIPKKECTHSYKRNVPMLPLVVGILKFLPRKKILCRLPLNQGPTTASQVEMMVQPVA